MTLKAAVIGHPVSHSLSPAIFGLLASAPGHANALDYRAVDVEPSALGELMKSLRKPEWVGSNVTIPHKEAILALVDEVTPAARAVGAGNVIHSREGKLIAHNTDVLGIAATLSDVKLTGATVLLLGAGGAARAAAYAVAQAGAAKLFVYNRGSDRAKNLARDFNDLFPKTQVAAVSSIEPEMGADVLVQATPIGMSGHASTVDSSNYGVFVEAVQAAAPEAVAFDMIYRPKATPFLEEARRIGLRTVGGLPMLIEQALATWEIWFGPLANRLSHRDALARFLEAQK